MDIKNIHITTFIHFQDIHNIACLYTFILIEY